MGKNLFEVLPEYAPEAGESMLVVLDKGAADKSAGSAMKSNWAPDPICDRSTSR